MLGIYYFEDIVEHLLVMLNQILPPMQLIRLEIKLPQILQIRPESIQVSQDGHLAAIVFVQIDLTDLV